jgi:hypothetical protein
MNTPPGKSRNIAIFWLAGLLLALSSRPVRGQAVVSVPIDLYRVAGNTNSTLPFGYPGQFTARYQQVYDASQFSNAANVGDLTNYFAALTNGGWISDLYFRATAYSDSFSATVPNAEIHLSTTSHPPDGLSPVFSENVGFDDTIVFSGSFTVGSASPFDSPEPYDFDHIALSKNFWYDPRAGNLLLDVRLNQGLGPAPVPPFDAVNLAGDSVSRVYATSAAATSGTADTFGVVTFFAMAPPPIFQGSVSNFSSSTNYFVVTWLFTQPTGFVLQVSSALGKNAVWQTVPGTLNTNIASERFQFPIDASLPKRFFRFSRSAGP